LNKQSTFFALTQNFFVGAAHKWTYFILATQYIHLPSMGFYHRSRNLEMRGQAMHQLRTKGDPILKTICEPITEFSTDELYEIVKDMRQIMQLNKGVGLAGPQIGEAKRIIIVQKQRNKGIWVVVNPVIVHKSEYTNKGVEGCLSYPGIQKEALRPNGVRVSGKTLDGKDFLIDAIGLEARIFFHEMDHLEGKCIVGM
jgi:peptide deformylase